MDTKQYDFEFQPTITHKNRFFIYYLQLNFFLSENSAAFPRINGPEIHSTVTWSVSGKLDVLNHFRRNKADASSTTLSIMLSLILSIKYWQEYRIHPRRLSCVLPLFYLDQ